MRTFFNVQQTWSYNTFGTPDKRGPKGPLLHLKKEVEEAIQLEGHPFGSEDFRKFQEELVDCQFLIFDAVHRAGITYDEFVMECYFKLRKNMNRYWPSAKADEPVEHDRSKEQ